jgi:putative SOS response-associated peptidase YedK
MCGRFTLTRSAAEVAEHFGIGSGGSQLELVPRYNVAPTQDVAVVRAAEEGRRLELRHWGLVPHWAKDAKSASRMINARAETAAERPAYRDAMRRRRCLVPSDGFYEWRPHPRRKRPHHIALPNGELFAIAGLYERWRGTAGEEIASVTLLTREATPELAPIHGRMPLVVDPESYEAWLDPRARDPVPVLEGLRQERGGQLVAKPVGFRVNDVHNDDPGCLQDDDLPLFRAEEF